MMRSAGRTRVMLDCMESAARHGHRVHVVSPTVASSLALQAQWQQRDAYHDTVEFKVLAPDGEIVDAPRP